MLRCPECGQAHTFKAKLEGGEIYRVIRCVNDKSTIQLVPGLFLNLEASIYDAVVEAECIYCREPHSLGTLVECYLAPDKFELEEHLCLCGGELFLENVTGTDKLHWVCDRCAWIKSDNQVDGGK